VRGIYCTLHHWPMTG